MSLGGAGRHHRTPGREAHIRECTLEIVRRDENSGRTLTRLMKPHIVARSEHPISRRQIDADALKVLYRLHRHGRIAYLVGGGVRDLLLERAPRDFDVVTDAHPGEVKRLFRNAWIIGRRFKLVHVVFGKNVIEVATFRAKSAGNVRADDGSVPTTDAGNGQAVSSRRLLVTRENTFGTAEQDAMRRDFTINGLFYDISDYSIIDYPGGLSDLKKRVVRTIGDAHIRFQEDPVRMMRAVKFAARLGFRLERETRAAIEQHAEAITWCAPPRLLEENFRLTGSGKALESFQLLHKTGLMAHLFPEVATVVSRDGQSFWRSLAVLDRWIAGGEEISRALQLAVVLLPLVSERVFDTAPALEAPGEQVETLIRAICQRMRVTRADTARVLQIYLAQHRFRRLKGRQASVAAFIRRGYFDDAFHLYQLHVEATPGSPESMDEWRERIVSVRRTGTGEASTRGQAGGERPVAPGRRRRRRRRRKSRRSPQNG